VGGAVGTGASLRFGRDDRALTQTESGRRGRSE